MVIHPAVGLPLLRFKVDLKEKFTLHNNESAEITSALFHAQKFYTLNHSNNKKAPYFRCFDKLSKLRIETMLR